MIENEKSCTILIHSEKGVPPSLQDFQKKIEEAGGVYMMKKNGKKLAEVLEELLIFMINGETYPKLLMTIIRYMVNCDDHRVKKLMTVYWELCDKTADDGSLKEEMLLVTNAILKDLLHHNEYVRGSTLRLLCRMRYFKLLEPLIYAIVQNLSHRHSYVRRNAVMCIYAIVKTFGPQAVPDAAAEVEKLLLVEGDISTKRNAFVMLVHSDIERVTNYVISMEEQISSIGDICQLVVLDLIKKVCRLNPSLRPRLLRIVFSLASSSTPAVAYECACAALALTASPVAVQLATQTFISLVSTQPDNSVKLIVLDRLAEVRKKHRSVIEELSMDALRGLNCPTVEVRRRVLDLVLGSLATSKHIADIISLLSKELSKARELSDGNIEYRRLLVKSLHSISRTFSDFAPSVVTTLADFLSDVDQTTSAEVLAALRDLVSSLPHLRMHILPHIVPKIPEIISSRVLRGALWLVGEFSASEETLESILRPLRPLPLPAPVETATKGSTVTSSKTVVLADGSYATVQTTTAQTEGKQSPFRRIAREGDELLLNLTASVISKILGNCKVQPKLKNECLFLLANFVKILKRDNRDAAAQRVAAQLRSALGPSPVDKKLWENSRPALIRVVASEAKPLLAAEERIASNVDRGVFFRQLRDKRGTGVSSEETDLAGPGSALSLAEDAEDVHAKLFSERLARSVPLTGLADPLYLEGFIHLNSLDLAVEIWAYNRTNETLQNVTIELCTHGDLKIVDRPPPVTLAAGESAILNASFKVSSTESGVIFGYATFDRKSGSETMVLNEMHADILDYLEMGSLAEAPFKQMWQDFEWENKLVISSNSQDAKTFLVNLMTITHLSLVGAKQNGKRMSTEEAELQISSRGKLISNSSFVSVNLCAKSVFGEDALANVSIETGAEGKLGGGIRIRARSQGLALSLGDRIASVMRSM